MKIRFDAIPMKLDAAAGEEKLPTITGLAVPWFPVSAVVSSGEKVAFQRGSFDVNQKPAKLIEGHDLTQLVGTVPELIDLEEGLGYGAQFARTTRSADAIELIRAGAYDAVSVGADVIESFYDKDSQTTVVTKALLLELSLVAIPAFQAASIDSLAASAPEEEEAEETPSTNQPEETQKVETPSTPEVEAATVPTVIYAQARQAARIPSPGEYIAAMKRGGSEFAQLNANIQAATGDVVLSDAVGLLPTSVVAPVFSDINPLRPIVNALQPRSMPQAGSSFLRPYVKVHSAAGQQSTELTALSTANFEVDDVSITKKTFGGKLVLSEQVVDWSSPSILDAAIQDMTGQYALATESETVSTLAGAMTAANMVTLTSTTDDTEFIQDIYTAAAAIANVGNYLPNALIVSPSQWAKLGSLVDGQGRPVFPQVAPLNGIGTLNGGVTAWNGNPLGLQLIVSNQVKDQAVGDQDADDYYWLLNTRAIECYEQQKGFIELRDPATLGLTISVRGYFAAAVIDPLLVRAIGPAASFA
jgi:HK97 family phage prohead protease